VPAHWDGQSFADAFQQGESAGRDYLVVSQNAWSCQRSARWDDYICIRSYHTGLKHYPRVQVYNVAEDPHETNDLAPTRPDLADHGLALIEQWTADMMTTSNSQIDPLWTVMREGGPLHTRGWVRRYSERLRSSGRSVAADRLMAKYGEEDRHWES